MLQKCFDEVKRMIVGNMDGLIEVYGIRLIYIFGSYAKGNNNEKSDVDIAVLLNNDYNPMDKLELIGELTSVLRREDIDLVILNSANPVLRHQVIKYGKLIYMENEDVKVDFEVKVLKEYMDMEPFRKVQMDGIKHWVEKTLGVDDK